MKSVFLALTLVLASFSPGVKAGESLDQAYIVNIRPRERVRIRITCEADWEQGLSIINFATGETLHTFNNYFNKSYEYVSPLNNTTDVLTLVIRSYHKQGGPHAGKPWLVSKMRVIDGGHDQGIARVGWDDSLNDGDYNDVSAVVTWIE